MKLIGSLQEREFEESLKSSHAALFSEHSEQGLLKNLRLLIPDLVTCYFLHQIPDQATDTYILLINDDSVVTVEIDREDMEYYRGKLTEQVSVTDYLKSITKIGQVKLTVALKLARKDIQAGT